MGTHCRTAGVPKAMLPFLCCLFASFVGYTLAVGTEDVIDCQKYPDNKACTNRASWGYLASNGPATWAANYGAAQGGYCDGMCQSPIDLDDSVAVMNDPGEITMVGYNLAQAVQISNNGHSLVFTYPSGATPYIMGGRLPEGERFNFLQLHWHWGSNSSQGSEHTLNGKEFPIEIHLVHVNTKYLDENGAPTNDNLVQPDGLAVLGVFYEISEEDNAGLTDVLAKVSDVAVEAARKRKKGRAGPVALDMSLALETLLPADTRHYYHYQGGLTTPTCNEAVLWTNFMSMQTISEAQLAIFRTMTDSEGVAIVDNYRPPQSLNARTLYTTGGPTTAVAGSNSLPLIMGTVLVGAVDIGLLGLAALLAGILGPLVVGLFLTPPLPPPQRSSGVSARAEQALQAGRDHWGDSFLGQTSY